MSEFKLPLHNLYSGLNNWTPNIDSIARNNIYFTNFYANGFITEDAEIAMLTGEIPISAPAISSKSGSVSFEGFYDLNYALPAILKKSNYQSEFITSSDLKFSNTKEWVNSIGFDYVEGSEHKDYDNLIRYHFNAPEDKYLYKRVLSRVSKNKNKPLFMFIKTVSSHVPFINPENKNRSEKETLQYIDKEIGNFYKKLKETNFFDNGMLILVGDHHPPIPVKEEALKKFGKYKAAAMVPMIISFGEKIQKSINTQFQQTDIYNTVLNYSNNEYCLSDWRGNFDENLTSTPKYIIHRRADHRSIFSVFMNSVIGNIYLDGDQTRFLEQDKLSVTEQKIILKKINFERIKKLNTKSKLEIELKKDNYFPRSALQN